jgi:hypothetical protein
VADGATIANAIYELQAGVSKKANCTQWEAIGKR